jgi:DNA-binding NarL/FixJ family response regulator
MIQVMIADDFMVMRYVMQRLLELAPDIRVVAEADTFDTAIQACQEHPCDVIILDDYLPPYPCDTAIAQLRQANVTAPILVTSMHADVNLAGGALNSGAGGFVLKTELQQHFITAVRALHAGETFLSPRITQQMAATAT